MSSNETECISPPPGWRCTRGAGHDGPCAAVPDAETMCTVLLQRASDTRAVPVLRAMEAEIRRLQEQLTQGCCRYSPNWAEQMMEPDPHGRYVEVLHP